MKKKIGLITFHRSYNCGSLLQAYALQKIVDGLGYDSEFVNFSSLGQREMYKPFKKNNNFKNLIKNFGILLVYPKVKNNIKQYQKFIKQYLNVGKSDYYLLNQLEHLKYNAVISGSDQVWNITIPDSDDAYFLPWVCNGGKIAYAVSFGAKNINKISKFEDKYAQFIKNFDAVSTREFNGRKWIKELANVDAPVVLDPTLLLNIEDYNIIEDKQIYYPRNYIFYYSPSYNKNINALVKQISAKYNLPVICFNTKSFFSSGAYLNGFKLPKYESPASYLSLIHNAELVITTSFHGTIFSSIYKKKFWTIKNGDMYGDDDRVLTLVNELHLENRLISMNFNSNFDYMQCVDYSQYYTQLSNLKFFSLHFLSNALSKYCI